MSFPAYPEYKDSGVEWVGEIPAHWQVDPFFAHLRERRVTNSRLAETNLLSLSYGRLVRKDIDRAEGLLPESYETYQIIEKDDLILRLTDLQNDQRSLRCAIATERGIISPAYVAVTPIALSARYAHYLLRSYDLVKVFYSMGGGLRQTMKFSDLKWLPLLNPPTSEQEQITQFLDRETAHIDALTAEQQRLIELLKEKRQAVISHAVTKGLDPDAPMKDSGVEWLGKVPEHWSVLAIKWLSVVQRGASPRPIDDEAYFDENGEHAWVRISDVTASDGILKTTSQTLSRLGSSLSVRLEPDSLFLSMAGSVGKPCITKIKACIHDGFVYFPELRVDSRFLYYIFSSGLCFEGLGNIGTQLNLNTDIVGSIRIALPPHDEINGIVEHIEQAISDYDHSIAEAERLIALLQERRSALISAAVTGKIDVRDWQPQDSVSEDEAPAVAASNASEGVLEVARVKPVA